MQFFIPVGNFVKKSGDTMAGTLDIQAGDLIAPEVVVRDGIVRSDVDNEFVEFLGSTGQLTGAGLKMFGEDAPLTPGTGVLSYGGTTPLANPTFTIVFIELGVAKFPLTLDKTGSLVLWGVNGAGGSLNVFGSFSAADANLVGNLLAGAAIISGNLSAVDGFFSGNIQGDTLRAGPTAFKLASYPIIILNGTSTRSIIAPLNMVILSVDYVMIETVLPGVSKFLTSHADVRRLVSINYVKATGVLQITSAGNVLADTTYNMVLIYQE